MSTCIRISVGNPYGWLSLLLLLPFLGYPAGGAQITLLNLCKMPISVCGNFASGSITLHRNDSNSPPEPSGSPLFLWACELGNNECINTQTPTATVAEVNIGNDSTAYSLSAEYGYNFALRIMPLGGTGCPTITCAANLRRCPNELQILDSSNNAVVACKAPDCSESGELCPRYSSLVTDSDCQTPSSSYSPSNIMSSCPASIDLVISFICN